jgi:hypothetical protein
MPKPKQRTVYVSPPQKLQKGRVPAAVSTVTAPDGTVNVVVHYEQIDVYGRK